jgi:phosphoribosylaminoimidazole (AIR) synthetase
MFSVFNMGVGLCAVVAPQSAQALCDLAQRHGHTSALIGRARRDSDRTVRIVPHGLTGREKSFRAG